MCRRGLGKGGMVLRNGSCSFSRYHQNREVDVCNSYWKKSHKLLMGFVFICVFNRPLWTLCCWFNPCSKAWFAEVAVSWQDNSKPYGLCEGHFMTYSVGDKEGVIYLEYAAHFHWLVLLVSEAGRDRKELLYIKMPVALLHFLWVVRHSFCFIGWIRMSLLQNACCQQNAYQPQKCWGRILFHCGLNFFSCNLVF